MKHANVIRGALHVSAVLFVVHGTVAQGQRSRPSTAHGAASAARRSHATTCPENPLAPANAHIVGGRFWAANQAPTHGGTLVIRGSEVQQLLPANANDRNRVLLQDDILLPDDAWVTPAFVATMSPIGLVEVELEDSANDSEFAGAPAIHAAIFAADAFNPRSELIPVARMGGIGSVLSVPRQGLVSGTSAMVSLANISLADAIENSRAAIHSDLDDGGIVAAGGARTIAFTRLRELLLDTRTYLSEQGSYHRRALRELSVPRAELEAMAAVLERRVPLAVNVSRAADIQRVLELATEFNLRLVLVGAEEGWLVAGDIARAGAVVAVDPVINLPSRFSALATSNENAARLAALGVPVLLYAPGAWNLNGLRHGVGLAIANGMDRTAALRAVTDLPLRTFDIQHTGSFERGQCADIAVWSGDPFETTTYLTHLWLRGVQVPLRSRQTELFERYRTLPAQRRPQ